MLKEGDIMNEKYEAVIEKLATMLKSIRWWKEQCRDDDCREEYAELRGAAKMAALLLDKDYKELLSDVRRAAE